MRLKARKVLDKFMNDPILKDLSPVAIALPSISAAPNILLRMFQASTRDCEQGRLLPITTRDQRNYANLGIREL